MGGVVDHIKPSWVDGSDKAEYTELLCVLYSDEKAARAAKERAQGLTGFTYLGYQKFAAPKRSARHRASAPSSSRTAAMSSGAPFAPQMAFACSRRSAIVFVSMFCSDDDATKNFSGAFIVWDEFFYGNSYFPKVSLEGKHLLTVCSLLATKTLPVTSIEGTHARGRY